MFKRSLILFFFTLFIFFHLSGKNLTFSHEIVTSIDNEVKEIAILWDNYFNASISNSDATIYWNKEEIASGINDIIKYSASPQVPIYTIGNHFTFDIRKFDDEFYEIITSFELGSDDNKSILSIYRICAKKTDDKYKLYNSLHCNKQLLKSYKIGRVNYYYPHSFSMNRKDIKKAKKTILTFNNIQNYYQIDANTPILYILANSIDECNSIIGFSYTKFRSHLKIAGSFIYPNILQSCHPDHLHELIHALFMPLYPNAPSLFHEGIATYYGGACQRNYVEHIDFLKEYLQNNPNIDLADFESYDFLIDNKTNPFYTVGALIIDHTLTVGGAKKTLELFCYTSVYESLEKVLNIPSNEIHQYIHNLILQN